MHWCLRAPQAVNLQVMAADRRVLLRLSCSTPHFSVHSELPRRFCRPFLRGRGLGPEELGIVLGAATAVRLVCGPIAGRVADRFQLFRAELAVCALVAAGAALLYFTVHGFWAVIAVSFPRRSALSFRDGGAALLQCDPMSEHGEVRPGRKFSTPVNRGDGAVTMLLARSFICRAWRP
jgi:hypothetical protein